MTKIDEAQEIIGNFVFKKGDYLGAEEQLLRFADSYEKLSVDEADLLRGKFDSKDRLGWLRIASALVCKFFSDTDNLHQDRLCKIFFALYSFENLDFGFDGVKDLIYFSEKVQGHKNLARKNWNYFSILTSNEVAKNNLENKIFI